MGFFKPNVKKLIQKRDVEGLKRALEYKKDLYVRLMAVAAHGDIADKGAVEPLTRALKDGNYFVQVQAVKALGNIKDARAVKPLTRALNDKNKYVRVGAAIALGAMVDDKALGTLIQNLKEELLCEPILSVPERLRIMGF